MEEEKLKTNITDYYEFREKLGSGSFSVVVEGVEKATQKRVAVKVISKRGIRVEKLAREISVMKKLHHPNILALFEVFEDPDSIYLVIQLADGGELFDKIVSIGCYPEGIAITLVQQLLSALRYLHDQGVAHRDLKPENVLCSSDYESTRHIYVADFGLSRNFEDSQEMQTFCGSPEYTAPEILNMLPYGKEVDLWAVGVITYIMLTGFLPFFEKNPTQLFDKIKKAEYNWESCPEISEEGKDFVAKLLTVDPKQRMTAVEALQHQWLKTQSKGSPIPRRLTFETANKTRYQTRNGSKNSVPERSGSGSGSPSGQGTPTLTPSTSTPIVTSTTGSTTGSTPPVQGVPTLPVSASEQQSSSDSANGQQRAVKSPPSSPSSQRQSQVSKEANGDSKEGKHKRKKSDRCDMM